MLALAGSTREDSVNKKLVLETAKLARGMGAVVQVVDLRDFPIPFFDGDLEEREGLPKNAKRLKDLISQNEVVVIASPEYNGSLSAVLKNAIDWISRSENGVSSRQILKGKKFIIMSASPGAGGGARGLVHLRFVLEKIGATVVPEEVIVSNAYQAFSESGELNEKKKKEIQLLLEKTIN